SGRECPFERVFAGNKPAEACADGLAPSRPRPLGAFDRGANRSVRFAEPLETYARLDAVGLRSEVSVMEAQLGEPARGLFQVPKPFSGAAQTELQQADRRAHLLAHDREVVSLRERRDFDGIRAAFLYFTSRRRDPRQITEEVDDVDCLAELAGEGKPLRGRGTCPLPAPGSDAVPADLGERDGEAPRPPPARRA